MQLTTQVIDLIKYYEGCFLKAYRDPVGLWTIGYGHLCTMDKHAPEPPRISQEEALALLATDLAQIARASQGLILRRLEPYEFSALVSFAFNLGVNNLKISTLLRKVNRGARPEEIAYEFTRWNKAGGQVLKGLSARRGAEIQLYLTGGFDPSKSLDYYSMYKH